MTNTDKAKIEARTILDKFGSELKNIKISSKIVIEGDECGVRQEIDGKICDKEFRTIMFKNAPKSDEECLIVEKGSWN